MRLTSPDNPRFRAALRLQQRKYRQREQQFLIEGLRFVQQAGEAHAPVRRVFVTEEFEARPEAEPLLTLLRAGGAQVFVIPPRLLARLSETAMPQGIVAVVDAPRRSLADLKLSSTPLLLLCDAVREPGNLGVLVRVADGAGADAVIVLPGSCEVTNPKALRATMGSVFTLPVVEVEDGLVALNWLRRRGIQIVVATPEAERSCFEVDFRGPVALTVGNEAHGVSPEIKATADLLVHIPMLGGAESLNVSSAGTVLLYEAVRQRLTAGPGS